MKSKSLLFALMLSMAAPAWAVAPKNTEGGKGQALSLNSFLHHPKLVLVLVIDQFRADYLTRFESRFLPETAKNGQVGGFKYLMSKGAYFPFAQYDVLQNMTGPGHAMILSGSYPYRMGIPINDWYGGTGDSKTYCVLDKDNPQVGGTPDAPGMSPKNFLGTTVGDELKNAGYHSQVVTVALKDRAAILMGGHRADIAVWFDPKAFAWVSSKFYLTQGKLPLWMQELNKEIQNTKGKDVHWIASGASTGLMVATDQEFSHNAVVGSKEAMSYPSGGAMTVQAAEHALKAYDLGKGKSTDILAVSFSSHDYLGHMYGPNSQEMEEMTVAEDRDISQLLNSVSKRVPGGLKDVLVVLTADHGIPPHPQYLKSTTLNGGRIDSDEAVQRVEKRLEDAYGKPESGRWIPAHVDLNYYINWAAVKEKKLNPETVENEIKDELLKTPGTALAFSKSDYFSGHLPPGLYKEQILHGYFPGRSGDVVVIPRIYYTDDTYPVSHMTGYAYDRTVPLVIAGPHIKRGVYSEHAAVIDLAPTLSFLLGVLPPTLSEGQVLSQIIAE